MFEGLFSPGSVRHLLGVGAILLGSLLLALVVFKWLQVWVRSTQTEGSAAGRGDWENALAGYKNLRDEGVLSEEEYRKIRTLVEPHIHAVPHGGSPSPPAERRGAVLPGDVGSKPPTGR